MNHSFGSEIEYDEDIYNEILFYSLIQRFNRYLNFLYNNTYAVQDEEKRNEIFKNLLTRMVNALNLIGDYKIVDDINKTLQDGNFYRIIDGTK